MLLLVLLILTLTQRIRTVIDTAREDGSRALIGPWRINKVAVTNRMTEPLQGHAHRWGARQTQAASSTQEIPLKKPHIIITEALTR